jgi:hypothetical protein
MRSDPDAVAVRDESKSESKERLPERDQAREGQENVSD